MLAPAFHSERAVARELINIIKDDQGSTPATRQGALDRLAFLYKTWAFSLIQAEFKRWAQDASVKGARINVQRVTGDDYEKVIHEAKACLRNAIAKAA